MTDLSGRVAAMTRPTMPSIPDGGGTLSWSGKRHPEQPVQAKLQHTGPASVAVPLPPSARILSTPVGDYRELAWAVRQAASTGVRELAHMAIYALSPHSRRRAGRLTRAGTPDRCH